ncbi:MAG: ImmA/IrrE family metallo-endopeptidase [Pseudohongiellaceae bacterium]
MPKKSVKALVKREILVWARESAGFNLDEVERSSALSKVRDWESGNAKPTINQLRLLAKKYKRPLAVFYLQERPTDFQVISDFRRLPETDSQRVSPALHLQIRAAQERREIALDLLAEMGEDIPQIPLSASLNDDPEEVGARVRSLLRVTEADQYSWRSNREAFNAWRAHIELLGVLVFQMDNVPTGEASGFALSEMQLPTIAVNRKDVLSRRTFSLLHEFAHLLMAASGISEFYIDVERSAEAQQIEVWCNAVAAAALIPAKMFMGADIVKDHDRATETWSDIEISELAHAFNMSKVSIVRRLLTLQLTSRGFYQFKEEQYAEEYADYLIRKKAEDSKKEFGGKNMTNEAMSLLGRNFVRMVIEPYRDQKITLSEASSYLNLKTRHISNVEKALMRPTIS